MKGKIVILSLVLIVLAVSGIAGAVPVYSPVTCHYYESISGNYSWNTAKSLAENLNYLGIPGYLATITSAEEQSWIISTFGPDEIRLHWLGGRQVSSTGSPGDFWQWITGEPWVYTNWNIADNPPQPDDQNGTEDGQENFLQFHTPTGEWNDYRESGDAVSGFMVEYGTGDCIIGVDIDIKPGSLPNSINPKSQGKISVAILTTNTFDATTVDPTTVLFGATGTEAAPVQYALEDVDGDLDTDIILHFNTQDTGIACGDTSASLTGKTLSGQAISGSDFIRTVGCK